MTKTHTPDIDLKISMAKAAKSPAVAAPTSNQPSGQHTPGALDQLDVAPKSNRKKTKPKLYRNTKVGARFTETECKQLEAKIKLSGLPQGEYVRRMLLDGEIMITQRSALDCTTLSLLSGMRADLGRLGSYIGVLIDAYKGQHKASVDIEDWISRADTTLQQLKDRVRKVEEDFYGDP